MRRPFICGNWKMNKNILETKAFIEAIKKVSYSKDIEVGLAPVFTNLSLAKELLKGSDIKLCAQNVHFMSNGAYTGEISAPMLKEIGLDYIIIGHSERRTYFAETNETVNQKIKASITNNLKVIFCIGETLAERENEKTFMVINEQLELGLKDINRDDILKYITIAYEPVWAIGTGKTATVEQASEVHSYIRNSLNYKFQSSGSELRILYGGSVSPDNIKALMLDDEIDGALVGGASLKVESFKSLITYNL